MSECAREGCGHKRKRHQWVMDRRDICSEKGCDCSGFLPPRSVPEEACVCGHERQHHPSGLIAIPVSTEWDECPGCRICDHQYPHDHNECDVPSRAAAVPAPHAGAEAEREPLAAWYARGYRDGYKTGYQAGQIDGGRGDRG